MSERFTWPPEVDPVETTTPNVREALFGDGYAQRVRNGINSIKRSWSLSFTGETQNVEDIVTFLRARAGVESFEWFPPSGDDGKWICKSWTRTPHSSGVQGLNATFEEDFGD